MFDQNDSSIMSGTMVLGRVKLFHVRDDIIDDNLLVDTAKLQVLLFILLSFSPLGIDSPRLLARLATRRDQLRSNDDSLRNPSTGLED